jgi:nitronate monooxygenase
MISFQIGDLTIPVPIIQGGMGIGISLSGLASAVANMGGVGVISTVGIGLINKNSNVNIKVNHIDAIREEIKKARQLTNGILGVNIMSVITNFPDMVRTSIEEGIDVIFSGAGLPLDLPKYLNQHVKTKLVPIVSSARAASIICKKWMQHYEYLPDAFVVEGPKAGGHLGFNPEDLNQKSHTLETLVANVRDIVSEMKTRYNKEIPIIAAGGIYSGKDMYQVMKKGASAVQLGTRFVATEECDASANFKNEFLKAEKEDIKIIKSPVGLPGRTIFNAFLKESQDGKRRPYACKYNCIKTCNYKTTSYCIADALLSAYKGNMKDGFAFSGTNAGKVDKISTVKEVFDDLICAYNEAEIKNSED